VAQAARLAEPRVVSAFLEILSHLLALPRVSPSRFMQTLKGYTARQANQLLQRAGQPFWQTESYDHSVRDLLEGQRIRAYIDNNPVKAGLAAQAEEYP
jgi:REP element-mobilizing transposase RayT